MIDLEKIVARLEAEAIKAGFPQNFARIEYTTAKGNRVMALITVTVSDPGIVESNDTASTPANTPVNIPVLANDIDNLTGDNSGLIVAEVTQPPANQGTVIIAPDRKSVIFTPAKNFIGAVQFSYAATRATTTE